MACACWHRALSHICCPHCRHKTVIHLNDAEAAYVAVVANEGVPDDTGPIDLHILTNLHGQEACSEAILMCRAGHSPDARTI